MKAELLYACGLAAVATVTIGSVLALNASPSAERDARVMADEPFVNWETPHVHPIDVTPDGSRLLAVNLPDARLEIMSLAGGLPRVIGSVPVGLDPVSVRAFDNDTAWVVNHVSDSISVVDLNAQTVVRTIQTQDEPCDVAFAGPAGGEMAFVSCSQANVVHVFDPTTLGAHIAEIPIQGQDPRALAVSPDGLTVYAAIFQGGNRSTILGGGLTMGGGFPPNVVGNPLGPYGGTNPPPNDVAAFDPPINSELPPPPPVGLIVKQQGQGGAWIDDNAADWTPLVSGMGAGASGRVDGWTLLDHDVAIIDAASLSVTGYVGDLNNMNMALAVNPASGAVTVVGTDGTNETRFEPNLNGRFVRVQMSDFVGAGAPGTVDLNAGHLTYPSGPSFTPIAQSERNKSIGDPRAIVWNSAGTLGYVAGMGSSNVIVIDAAGARAGLSDTINVGHGPTGLALDEARSQLYVMCKFDNAISVIDTTTELESAFVPFHDSTPSAIIQGRKFLYDTHLTSGLGQAACASCHVDARTDGLAWDLGDPSGEMKAFDQNCPDGGCEDWHPMKGPMTTQTMQDIIGLEPHHWRGDRFGIEEFNGAFLSINGDDQNLTDQEMQRFEDFLATIHFPPSPFRDLDNTLPDDLPLDGHYTVGRFGPAGLPLPNGDAQRGLDLYLNANLDGVECVTCHTLPTGTGPNGTFGFGGFTELPAGPSGELHHALVSVDGSTNISIKIPQLRNMHEKVGFNTTQLENTAGFGYLHDGSVDSIERFIAEPVFSIGGVQDLADMTAFMLAFPGSDLPLGSPANPLMPPGSLSQDTHAAVGAQVTLDGSGSPATLTQLVALADAGAIGLIAKGRVGADARGYRYDGAGAFQSDRLADTTTLAALEAGAAVGAEVTFTAVAMGMQTRLGLDRDLDGFFDRDELDACADPADPFSDPTNSTCCFADLTTDGSSNGVPDGLVSLSDFSYYLSLWSTADPAADLTVFNACLPGTPDGDVTLSDFSCYLSEWSVGCP